MPYFYHFLFTFRNQLSLCGIEPPPFFRAGIALEPEPLKGKTTAIKWMELYYHNSSALALNSFSENAYKKRLSIVRLDNPLLTKCYNTVLPLWWFGESSIMFPQRRAIQQILTGLTQRQAAQNLGFTEQNMVKLLKRAKWDLFSGDGFFLHNSSWKFTDSVMLENTISTMKTANLSGNRAYLFSCLCLNHIWFSRYK